MRDFGHWEKTIVARERAIESLSKRAEEIVTINALFCADVQNVLRDAQRGLDDERMELAAEKRDATATNE